MKKLTEEDILEHLATLSGWEIRDNTLTKSYSFNTFSDALIFANLLGEHAEEVSHHPELTVRWGECSVALTTHDVDGVSSRDTSFATYADDCFRERFLKER